MKKTIAILLTGICLFHVAEQLAVITLFCFNRGYIARNVCEQRKVQNNCCQGSCFIKKNLDNAEGTAKKTPATVKEQEELNWFVQQTEIKISVSGSAGVKKFAACHARLPQPASADIFHPPAKA